MQYQDYSMHRCKTTQVSMQKTNTIIVCTVLCHVPSETQHALNKASSVRGFVVSRQYLQLKPNTLD